MSKGRKTINVDFLKDYANKQLERTDEFATKEFKIGVTAMIERTLHTSENYNGFHFLNNNDSEVGTVGYYSRKYY